MSNFKKFSISIFFLTTFLLLRIINIHEISHIASDNDSNHCEQCVLNLQENKVTPIFLGTGTTDFPVQSTFNLNTSAENISTYSAPQLKVLQTDFFFNKPPPYMY